MVKFARHLPPKEIMERAWQDAYRVVELTQLEEGPADGEGQLLGAGDARPPAGAVAS